MKPAASAQLPSKGRPRWRAPRWYERPGKVIEIIILALVILFVLIAVGALTNSLPQLD